MTDKANEPSSFSFRMFDLYRRFVEVLQLNPEFLQDFKNGTLSIEICQFVIKNVFKLRQTEEKAAFYVNYLMKNSKIIASHAEDIPSHWNEAINYTDQCIKVIRKYLKEKGISLKTNFDFQSIKEIATDIAVRLHETPNESHIEAIKEYLKYDIQNPKKTIISADKKSTIKTKKSRKSKDADKEKVKKISLKMILNKLDKETVKIESDQNINSIHLLEESNEKNMNEESLDSGIKKEIEEESTKAEFMKNIEIESQYKNVLLQNENKKTFLDTSHKVIEDRYENGDSESIKLLQDSIKCENQANECTIMKLNDQVQSSYQGEEKIKNVNTLPSNHYELKRKNQDDNEKDASSGVKKIFVSNDLLVPHNDQYVTVTYNDNDSNQYEMVQFSDLDTARNETVYVTANDENIFQHINDNDNFNEQDDNESKLNAEDLSNHITKNENIVKHIKNVSKYNFGKLNSCDQCNTEQEIKYSSVRNMSYTEMLKLIETVIAFCELNDEISLEEFLILRRTRDKIHWRSLKEI